MGPGLGVAIELGEDHPPEKKRFGVLGVGLFERLESLIEFAGSDHGLSRVLGRSGCGKICRFPNRRPERCGCGS